jgi:hypothetical protein
MRTLIVLMAGLAAPVLAADDAADSAVLKKMLSVATKGGPDLQSSLNELARQVSDTELRGKAQRLALDLVVASSKHDRARHVENEVKRLNGKVVTEPGGPAWLAPMVGPEALTLFTRLTEIELNEHTDGHAERKPRPKGQTVGDEWLRVVTGLPDLTRLELSGTAISDQGVEPIGTLKSLERLNLCLTPVSDACLRHLAGLSRLRRLVICSTKVTGSGFSAVPAWPNIESINLHSCPVSDEGLAAISRFGNLQRLEIVHSKVTDAGLKHLGKLTNLRQLHVASHGTTRHGLAFVEKLTKLYQLDLYEELASNEGLSHACKLPNLKILNLYSGPADDTGLAPLRQLTNLEELTIGGLGKVTDAGVEHLVGLKSLKQLKVNGTRISDSGMKRLLAALPATQVTK